MIPEISVVVPTFRRPRELARCLSALAAQRAPGGTFEVIVVDDGGGFSLAPPPDVAERMDLAVVVRPNGGPAAARNTGAERARGRLIAFTDDDCEPDPGWLPALVAAATAAPGAAIGGRTVNGLPDNPYASASQALAGYVYDYYNRGEPRFFASNNLCVPREEFLGVGGFDAAFRVASEDREFCDRWLASGRRLAYEPEAVVRHRPDLTLSSFLRQHYRYGRGAVAFHRARARRGGGPVALEPARFYAGMIRAGRAAAPSARGVAVAALVALTQAASAAGYIAERVGARRA